MERRRACVGEGAGPAACGLVEVAEPDGHKQSPNVNTGYNHYSVVAE